MNLTATVSVLAGATLVVAYLTIIGLAVWLLTRRFVSLPTGVPFLAGYGLVTVAIIVTLTQALATAGRYAIWAVTIGALATIGFALIRHRKQLTENPRRILSDLLAPNWQTNLVLAGLAAISITPLLAFGMRAWAFSYHDFPYYVSSVQVWLTSQAEFTHKLADPQGEYLVYRSFFEKPAVTAYLATLSEISTLNTTRLLLIAILPLAWMSLCLMGYAIQKTFNLKRATTILAVAVTGLGVLPMARLFDAQPGHLQALALSSLGLALIAHLLHQPTLHQQPFRVGAVVGAVVATALLSNVSLVVSAAPALLGVIVWMALRARLPWKAAVRSVLGLITAVAVVTLPCVFMATVSLGQQSKGNPYLDFTLSSPLGLVGLQLGHPAENAMAGFSATISWFVLTALLLIVAAHRIIHKRRITGGSVAAALFAINWLLLAAALGVENYGMHKWITFVTVTIVPFGIAYLASRTPRARKAAPYILAIAAAISVFNTWQVSHLVQTGGAEYVSDDTLALEHDPVLAREPQVNIFARTTFDWPHIQETPNADDYLPLLVPTRTVTASRWGIPKSNDNRYLISLKDARFTPQDLSNVTQLNDTYVLATVSPEKVNAILDYMFPDRLKPMSETGQKNDADHLKRLVGANVNSAPTQPTSTNP